ncbi:MAG: response regulator [Vicinamibacterales bacterium]
MTTRHRALIVEDDEATVEDLVEILRSISCDYVAVPSFEEAIRALRESTFCFILLDLQIKRSPDAIRGHVEHGSALLREIRRMCPQHTGRAFWLPVIVVSGFANEVSAAVDVMKDGAGDVVHKPLKSREVSEGVRRALERSGRATHDRCGPAPPEVVVEASTDVQLAIPGDRIGRRTRVTVGQKAVELTDGSLKVLLRLMVAHREGRGVHKIDLGAKADQGFKGISVLREALKGALPSGVDIIDNDYRGTYTLAGNVAVGVCDTEKLRAIGDRTSGTGR